MLGRKIGPAFLGLPESHKDTGRGGLQRPGTVPGSQEEAGRPPAASWPGCRFQPGKENFLKRNDSPGRRPRRGSRAPRELRRDLHIRLPPERVFLLNWPPGFPNRKVELTGNLGPPCALGSEGNPESASTSRPPALGGAVGRAAREMRIAQGCRDSPIPVPEPRADCSDQPLIRSPPRFSAACEGSVPQGRAEGFAWIPQSTETGFCAPTRHSLSLRGPP